VTSRFDRPKLSTPIQKVAVIPCHSSAQASNTPADNAAKPFTRLTKAGIVESTEGIRGGYALAKFVF